ncbi:MAG: enoyl-CoA hydratase-related protein [Desulfobacterales bacterium]|nr:enoyl-CoA hydratase-related protein [Desulfobacterales bacterium]
MPYETITLEQDGPIGIITLQRPDRLNAVNVRMVLELRQAIDLIKKDESIRVLILTGASDKKNRPCFCAGADMKEAPFPDTFLLEFNDLVNRIEDLRMATIAAIDGVCTAGGLELCMGFDLRVVAQTARIGDLHLKNLGVGLGGAGASSRLPRIVGLARAKELMFTGDLVDGAEAYRMGLANKVCPSDQLMAAAKAMARKIALMRPHGLAVTKAHLNLGVQMDLQQALRFADIIGPLADAEGLAQVEKKQTDFARKNQKAPENKAVEQSLQAKPALSGKLIPIKPGLFTLPSSPGEAPHLIGTRCRSCGEVYFPPKKDKSCANCHGLDMEEIPLGRKGTVFSYTVVHMAPPEWQGPVPYAVALIDLPEKARFYSALTGCKVEDAFIGMEVELVIEKVRADAEGNDVAGYKFRPVSTK